MDGLAVRIAAIVDTLDNGNNEQVSEVLEAVVSHCQDEADISGPIAMLKAFPG